MQSNATKPPSGHSKQHFKVTQNDNQPRQGRREGAPHFVGEPGGLHLVHRWVPLAGLAWSRFTLPSALLTFTPLTCVGFCQICNNTWATHTHTTHTHHTLSAGHAASLLYPHLSLSCSSSPSLFETRKFCAIKIFVQLFFGLAARVGVMGLCNNFYLKCVGERERATERERGERSSNCDYTRTRTRTRTRLSHLRCPMQMQLPLRPPLAACHMPPAACRLPRL